MRYLITIALLCGVYFSLQTFLKPQAMNPDIQQILSPPADPTTTPRSVWPPRAEDGRTESFFQALKTYFNTLLAADQIVEDAKAVAEKAQQREQLLDEINAKD